MNGKRGSSRVRSFPLNLWKRVVFVRGLREAGLGGLPNNRFVQ